MTSSFDQTFSATFAAPVSSTADGYFIKPALSINDCSQKYFWYECAEALNETSITSLNAIYTEFRDLFNFQLEYLQDESIIIDAADESLKFSKCLNYINAETLQSQLNSLVSNPPCRFSKLILNSNPTLFYSWSGYLRTLALNSLTDLNDLGVFSASDALERLSTSDYQWSFFLQDTTPYSGEISEFINVIGLRGEGTRTFLLITRFRRVDSACKNIFIIFFSSSKWQN